MNFFECCHYCKPPKRHPGCHEKCGEYKKGRDALDAINAAKDKARLSEPKMSDAQASAIRRNLNQKLKLSRNRKNY
jgi:hypothetical protein